MVHSDVSIVYQIKRLLQWRFKKEPIRSDSDPTILPICPSNPPLFVPLTTNLMPSILRFIWLICSVETSHKSDSTELSLLFPELCHIVQCPADIAPNDDPERNDKVGGSAAAVTLSFLYTGKIWFGWVVTRITQAQRHATLVGARVLGYVYRNPVK
eukprot:scaffold91680_cov98-Cyclotella_meneghiniana.AAC.1